MHTSVTARRRLKERGEGKTQLYVTFGVIFIIAFAMYKFIPVYYNSSDFNVQFEELARTATIRGEDDKKIRDRFLKIRNDYQIPEETCKFDIERKSGSVIYKLEYHIPVNFPGYTYDWEVKKDITEAAGKF